MKKIIIKLLLIFVGLYMLLCGLLYFYQEDLIFFPEKIDKNYNFPFLQKFEEINTTSSDGYLLNGLLFHSANPKGAIFYLHGNAGSLQNWGDVAQTYTDLDYDVFIFDYRSFGKSDGTIDGEQQLFDDDQMLYNKLKKRYDEKNIIVLGYSIGTGLAAKLASTNNPKLLILQAPYYNLTDVMRRRFSFIPTFLLKYKFETNQYLKECRMPLVIFHGKQDNVIGYDSSLKLKNEFKTRDTLIPLEDQGHNRMTTNRDYKIALQTILSKYDNVDK